MKKLERGIREESKMELVAPWQRLDFLRILIDALPNPFYVVDARTHVIVLANDATGPQAVGTTCYAHTHHRTDPCAGHGDPCTLAEVLRVKAAVSVEHIHFDASGCARNVRVHGYPIIDDTGDIRFMIETGYDITEQRQAESALRESERRLKDFLDSASDLIQSVDPDGRFLFVNRAWRQRLGYGDDELQGLTLADILHPSCREACLEHFRQLQQGAPIPSVEAIFVARDGTQIEVEGNASGLVENGRFISSRGIFRDITARKSAERQMRRINELLRHQATTDPLTGVCNRLRFNDMIEVETERSRRYLTPLSLVMFDVDHFKLVNDTLGHHKGDAVLRDLSSLVGSHIRTSDTLARWGGEEFMILTPNTAREHVLAMAEKLREVIASHDFRISGQLTCSFGVAFFESSDTVESFARRADLALYRAKDRGRNRVEAG